MGRRVNGDASEGRMVGEAEWRGPPPLSRERGRAPFSTRAGWVPPPSARGVRVTPPRRPSGGATVARERYALPSLWPLPPMTCTEWGATSHHPRGTGYRVRARHPLLARPPFAPGANRGAQGGLR